MGENFLDERLQVENIGKVYYPTIRAYSGSKFGRCQTFMVKVTFTDEVENQKRLKCVVGHSLETLTSF